MTRIGHQCAGARSVAVAFIAAWNEYVVALTLMIDDEKKPLTVGMRAYVTGYEQHWINYSPRP